MDKSFIKQIYNSAPDEIKDLISSEDLIGILNEVSRLQHLRDGQKNSLGNEITLRLIGLTKKADFSQKIQKVLETSLDVSNQIQDFLEKNLLSKIPEKILTTQEEYAQTKLSGPDSTIKSIPEIGESNVQLATTVIVEKHSDLPMVVENKPKTSLTFEERKKLVPNLPKNNSHYADKIDPYREPI